MSYVSLEDLGVFFSMNGNVFRRFPLNAMQLSTSSSHPGIYVIIFVQSCYRVRSC